jgi:hypothetical protein
MKGVTKDSKPYVIYVLASKNIYASVLKTMAMTNFIWQNPKDVEEQEEVKRRSPQSKYLQGLSACITVLVLWGIFWQVNNHLLPQLMSSFRFSRPEQSPFAQVEYNAYIGEDLVSSVGGRRLAGMHLLHVDSEEDSSQPREGNVSSFGGSSAPDHRNLQSYEELPK